MISGVYEECVDCGVRLPERYLHFCPDCLSGPRCMDCDEAHEHTMPELGGEAA